MGIQVSDGMANLLRFLSGEDYPAADESKLFAIAQAYEEAAKAIEEAAPLLAKGANYYSDNVSGHSKDSLVKMLRDDVLDPDDGYLTIALTSMRGQAKLLHNLALEVQYTKILIYIMLLDIIREFATGLGCTATSPVALLASLAKIARYRAVLKAAQFSLKRIIARIAEAMAFSIEGQLLIDTAAQLIQMASGSRTSFDWNKTKQAVEIGAVSALVGIPINQLGNAITKSFFKSIGKEGSSLAKHLVFSATQIGAESAEEYLGEAAYGLLKGNGWDVSGWAAASGIATGGAHLLGSHIRAGRGGPSVLSEIEEKLGWAASEETDELSRLASEVDENAKKPDGDTNANDSDDDTGGSGTTTARTWNGETTSEGSELRFTPSTGSETEPSNWSEIHLDIQPESSFQETAQPADETRPNEPSVISPSSISSESVNSSNASGGAAPVRRGTPRRRHLFQ